MGTSALHRRGERVEHFLAPVGLAHAAVVALRRHRDVPVSLFMAAAVRLDGQDRGGRQLAHSLQDRARRRNDRVQRHVIVQRRRIDGGVDAAAGEQRGQGGGEAQAARVLCEIERLDAEPVAREHDAAAVALPDREREHAAEALDAARAPGMPGLENDFGVAAGEEAVAAGFQLPAQFAEIIDAAVERDREPERGVAHRLLRGGVEIENAQPAMRKGDVRLREKPGCVGPARFQLVGHLLMRSEVRMAVIKSDFAA
jgi:hypothetical protein